MKITKIIANPIHAGSLLIDKPVTVLGYVSSSDLERLKAWESQGHIRIDSGEPSKAQTRQTIQEADGVIAEEPIAAAPKRAKRRPQKKSSSKTDG